MFVVMTANARFDGNFTGKTERDDNINWIKQSIYFLNIIIYTLPSDKNTKNKCHSINVENSLTLTGALHSIEVDAYILTKFILSQLSSSQLVRLFVRTSETLSFLRSHNFNPHFAKPRGSNVRKLFSRLTSLPLLTYNSWAPVESVKEFIDVGN